MGVGVLAREIMDDFQGVTAEDGIVAQAVFPDPQGGDGAVGQNFLTDGLVDGGVIVRQQADQRPSLVFIQLA